MGGKGGRSINTCRWKGHGMRMSGIQEQQSTVVDATKFHFGMDVSTRASVTGTTALLDQLEYV